MNFVKDPSAKKDYSIDWSAYLGEDTINTSTWSVPDGLTEHDEMNSNTTTLATVWISGGSSGSEYLVTNQITTAAGIIDQRSIKITVREQ